MRRVFCGRFLAMSIVILQCAFSGASAFCSFRGPHIVGLGPEIYFMQRKKEGGSHQSGNLYGVQLKYDRIRRSAIYWGGNAQWAAGTLTGHTALGGELKSHKRDSEIEGRIGYTWKRKLGCNFWLTPFIGGGYFEGTNRFIYPSPSEYKLRGNIPYLLGGFLSRFDIKPCFSIGLNFKAKYSVGARNYVIDDARNSVGDGRRVEIEKERLIIEDKFFYNVELPLFFDFCCYGKRAEISLVPFYNFRHYGAHDNFPHNFIEARFHMYGARLVLSAIF